MTELPKMETERGEGRAGRQAATTTGTGLGWPGEPWGTPSGALPGGGRTEVPAHGPAAVHPSHQLPYRLCRKGSQGEVPAPRWGPLLTSPKPIRAATTRKMPPQEGRSCLGHSALQGAAGKGGARLSMGRGVIYRSCPAQHPGQWDTCSVPKTHILTPKCTHRSTPQEIWLTGTNAPQETYPKTRTLYSGVCHTGWLSLLALAWHLGTAPFWSEPPCPPAENGTHSHGTGL